MKSQELTQYLQNHSLCPNDEFQQKLSELYHHTMAKYERRSEAIQQRVVTSLSDRLHAFLHLLLMLPSIVKDVICPLNFREMRMDTLIKYLNTLTKLFAMQIVDENEAYRRIYAVLRDDFGLLWSALARSNTNSQPGLMESLIYDGLVTNINCRLCIGEYGSFMLCITYYRMFTLEKKLEIGIQNLVYKMVSPGGMVSYLSNIIPCWSFEGYDDLNLRMYVYEICGLPVVLHTLNSRFGTIGLPPIVGVNIERPSIPADASCSVSSPDLNQPGPSTRGTTPHFNLQDTLITRFQPPRSYREVKTFLYTYGSVLLTSDEDFVRSLHDKFTKFSQRIPITDTNTLVHNFMALYAQITNIIRQSETVNPINATVLNVILRSEPRTDIRFTYANESKVCRKIVEGTAVGLYVNGEARPTILGIVHEKGQMRKKRNNSKPFVTYREATVRCILPFNVTIKSDDAIALTEPIDVQEQLYQANCILCRLNGRDQKSRDP